MVTVRTVRSIVGTLPSTSEKAFSSGAPRFLVADRPFAHMTPDLRTLVVRVDAGEWEALHSAVDAPLRPEPRAYPRQRARFAAVDLAASSRAVVNEALVDAWLTCAPRAIVTSWHANPTDLGYLGDL